MCGHKMKPFDTISVFNVRKENAYGDTTTFSPETLAFSIFLCSDRYCKTKRMKNRARKEKSTVIRIIVKLFLGGLKCI